MKKKIILSVIVFLAVFLVAGVVKTKAGTSQNVSGWIWGGANDTVDNTMSAGVGWISMNSRNCDANSDGYNDACDINDDGSINATDTAMVVADYGVNIPATDGDLSGYAWSKNIGSIAFAGSYLTGCPAGNGACSARRVGNSLEGWARIVDIADQYAIGNSGGWQGWIKLNGPSYGITINPTDGTLSGYAWSGGEPSGDELGAISFKGTNYGAHLPARPTVTLTPNYTVFNLKTETFPKTVALTWSSTNATSCSVISSGSGGTVWTESGMATSGTKNNISVTVGTNRVYTMTCTGSGGTSDPATATVASICYPKTCNPSQQCSEDTGNNSFLGASNISVCESASSCSINSDCTPRSTGTWREVQP